MRRPQEVPGKHPIERALDPVDAYPVGHEEVAREAIPLLADTQAQAERREQRQIDPRLALVRRLGRTLLSRRVELWRREVDVPSRIQQARHLRGLQGVGDRHRRVVVLPVRHDARERENPRGRDHGERQLAKEGRARRLRRAQSSIYVEWDAKLQVDGTHSPGMASSSPR